MPPSKPASIKAISKFSTETCEHVEMPCCNADSNEATFPSRKYGTQCLNPLLAYQSRIKMGKNASYKQQLLSSHTCRIIERKVRSCRFKTIAYNQKFCVPFFSLGPFVDASPSSIPFVHWLGKRCLMFVCGPSPCFFFYFGKDLSQQFAFNCA